MFRQDRTNPSTAVSNWKGRRDSKKGHPQTAVSAWLNGGLFGVGVGDFCGYMQASNNYTIATKFGFPTETYAAIATLISNLGSYCCTGISNNQVAGYSVSGTNLDGDPTSRSLRSWKIAVPNDVCSEVAAAVTEHMGGFGYSNSGTAGYFGSGIENAGSLVTSIEKFTYSSDTSISAISGTVSYAHYYAMGMAKSGDRGLSCGGWGGATAPGDVMNTVSFASDTSSTVASLSAGTYGGTAYSNGQVAGYVLGGQGLGTAIDKYDYSSFSRSTLSATGKAGYSAGWANTGVAGYQGAADDTANQSKLDFSSETTSAPAGSMGSPWTGGNEMMAFSTCESSP